MHKENMKKTEESLKKTQESFNKFFANNYAEAAVIDSMRNRLIDYGVSMVRGKLAANMLERQELKEFIVHLPEEGPIDNSKRVIQAQQFKHALSYILVTPDKKPIGEKLIGIEIDFNLYKLHWGICIYSKKSMLSWPGSSHLKEFANKYAILGYDDLGKYAKAKGVIVDGNEYQNNLEEANKKDKIYSIASVQVTGNREKDADNIAKKLEEIILKLLGGEAVPAITDSAITDPEPKPKGEDHWKTLCDDYRSQHLLETPTKIKTFLEIAGIQSREVYISKILEFFLNANEHHPFGNIFVRSFHNLYRAKKDQDKKKEQEKSKYAKVEKTHTEYPSIKGGRIDILVETDSYVLAIENKIYAGLQNDLEDYNETATDVAKEDGKDVVCVVLAPFAMSKDDQQKLDNDEHFVFIAYEELFNEVIKHFNEVDVYHKNKHFLYMQLFYDLFRTIKNFTYGDGQEQIFADFIGQKNNAYWARQAIHRCIDYKNNVLEKVKEEVKVKLKNVSKGSSFHWYGEVKQAIYIGSTDYASANQKYMPTHILAYDTPKHQINEDTITFTIDIGFDYSTGNWQMEYFFRGKEYSLEHLEDIKNFMSEHKFDVLGVGDAAIADQRYRIKLHPQPTKEATEKLITNLLIDSICKLEGSKNPTK